MSSSSALRKLDRDDIDSSYESLTSIKTPRHQQRNTGGITSISNNASNNTMNNNNNNNFFNIYRNRWRTENHNKDTRTLEDGHEATNDAFFSAQGSFSEPRNRVPERSRTSGGQPEPSSAALSQGFHGSREFQKSEAAGRAAYAEGVMGAGTSAHFYNKPASQRSTKSVSGSKDHRSEEVSIEENFKREGFENAKLRPNKKAVPQKDVGAAIAILSSTPSVSEDNGEEEDGSYGNDYSNDYSNDYDEDYKLQQEKTRGTLLEALSSTSSLRMYDYVDHDSKYNGMPILSSSKTKTRLPATIPLSSLPSSNYNSHSPNQLYPQTNYPPTVHHNDFSAKNSNKGIPQRATKHRDSGTTMVAGGPNTKVRSVSGAPELPVRQSEHTFDPKRAFSSSKVLNSNYPFDAAFNTTLPGLKPPSFVEHEYQDANTKRNRVARKKLARRSVSTPELASLVENWGVETKKGQSKPEFDIEDYVFGPGGRTNDANRSEAKSKNQDYYEPPTTELQLPYLHDLPSFSVLGETDVVPVPIPTRHEFVALYPTSNANGSRAVKLDTDRDTDMNFDTNTSRSTNMIPIPVRLESNTYPTKAQLSQPKPRSHSLQTFQPQNTGNNNSNGNGNNGKSPTLSGLNNGTRFDQPNDYLPAFLSLDPSKMTSSSSSNHLTPLTPSRTLDPSYALNSLPSSKTLDPHATKQVGPKQRDKPKERGSSRSLNRVSLQNILPSTVPKVMPPPLPTFSTDFSTTTRAPKSAAPKDYHSSEDSAESNTTRNIHFHQGSSLESKVRSPDSRRTSEQDRDSEGRPKRDSGKERASKKHQQLLMSISTPDLGREGQWLKNDQRMSQSQSQSFNPKISNGISTANDIHNTNGTTDSQDRNKKKKKKRYISAQELNRQLPPTPSAPSAKPPKGILKHKTHSTSTANSNNPINGSINSNINNKNNNSNSLIQKIDTGFTSPPLIQPYDPVNDYLPQYISRMYSYWRLMQRNPDHDTPSRYCIWVCSHLRHPTLWYHIQPVLDMIDVPYADVRPKSNSNSNSNSTPNSNPVSSSKPNPDLQQQSTLQQHTQRQQLPQLFSSSRQVNSYILYNARGHIKAQEEIARYEFTHLKQPERLPAIVFNASFLRIFNKIKHYYHPDRLAVQYYDRVSERIRGRLGSKFYEIYDFCEAGDNNTNSSINNINNTNNTGSKSRNTGQICEIPGYNSQQLQQDSLALSGIGPPKVSISLERLMQFAEQVDDAYHPICESVRKHARLNIFNRSRG